MSEETTPGCQLCWIQKEDGTETICRSVVGLPCTVADLGTDTPTTLDLLHKRLAGVKDARLQEADAMHAVVVCTFPRKRKLLEDLEAIGRHTPGRRTIEFPRSDEDRTE